MDGAGHVNARNPLGDVEGQRVQVLLAQPRPSEALGQHHLEELLKVGVGGGSTAPPPADARGASGAAAPAGGGGASAALQSYRARAEASREAMARASMPAWFNNGGVYAALGCSAAAFAMLITHEVRAPGA